jgi:hypothetical protein
LGSGGTNGAGAAVGNGPVCFQTDEDKITNDTAQIDGVATIYTFGDGLTTACLSSPATGQVCLDGTASDSSGPEDEYEYWGAAMGFLLASADADGNVVMPFDATALGITHVKFTLTGVGSAPVRVRAAQANTPELPDGPTNYQENAFGWGPDTSNDITMDSTFTLALEVFELPSWTRLDVAGDGAADVGAVLDPSQLFSLEFQVGTNPNASVPYDFCVSDLEWLTAEGDVVDVPEPVVVDASSMLDAGPGGAPSMGAMPNDGGL